MREQPSPQGEVPGRKSAAIAKQSSAFITAVKAH